MSHETQGPKQGVTCEVPLVRVDLQGVRTRLAGDSPRRYFKSLEELAETPAFLEFLHREFPQAASEFDDPKGRREFMRVMGASVALANGTPIGEIADTSFARAFFGVWLDPKTSRADFRKKLLGAP